ncbi:centrosomal protein of 192 kDa isoform X1 [Chionomys nivalis]|uniref:centrosomal protein of 192 kDa isoform X1 n=3 Tax=Chionomys nivalis TaxID=269649 RepID=UPI0025936591|nr:centrosomal protein of 192 kDa isoform X1 [Chionomys nivalis]
MTILPFAVTILKSCFWYFHYPRTNLSSRLQICGPSSCEMENFRGIAEESFPSFLTNSLLGNSEVLENVTLSSNFGLPIAVSTLARNRSSIDNRCPDVQASYLTEGRLSVPFVSSPSCQGDNTEPRGRLQLSFQGDEKKSYIENPHLSLALMKPRTEEKQADTTTSVQCQRLLDEVSPLEQVSDSALDFHLKSWMNNQEHKTVMPDAGKHLEDKAPNSDFSHISLLENEKLLTLTNLEDSSDDDINDEEFYDDHLEAYFEQLAVPGMLYEAGGQESPENVFKLPANGNNILNCEFQLENNSSLVFHGAYTSGSSGTTHRESEEGRGCLLGTSGYAGILDNIKQVDNVLPFYSYTWRTEKEGAPNLMDVVPDQSRECAGEAVLGKELCTVDETLSPHAGEAVLGEKLCTVDETPSPRAGEAALGEKLCTVDETPSPRAGEAALGEKPCTVDETPSPHYRHSTDDAKGGFDLADSRKRDSESPHQNKHLTSDLETVLNVDRCLNTETPSVFIQKGGSVSSLKTNGDNGINSPDTLWSPTCERRACEFYESVTKSNDQADLSQNIVYQNEDGKWVTDLAYYTSFTDQQDLQMSPNNETNEDFRSGTEALDLIAKDEEEFNKEHPFIQDEKIDVQNTSAALDASWVATVNYHLLRKSLGTSDFDKDDGSYLRLSLGEFFAQRSEALGCLGGGSSVKRPSFGYFIRSPEEREPFALLKPDVSRSNLEKEVTHLHQGLFSGNLNEQSQAQLSKGSITLQAEELQSTPQGDENDVTLTANGSRTEDIFCSNNKLEEHKSALSGSGDSVLRISTIASAIADVSVSTDPAQLVAMMKALKNKRRDKTFQDDDTQEDCSTSHFLINDVEKSNRFNAFDMEKYLTKTEVSSCEGTWEPFLRAGTSDIWDLCLLKQQTVQDISMANVCAANVRQPKADSAAVFYGENTESETQESLRTLASPDSGLSNMSENRSTVIGRKAGSIDELPDVQTIEKAASVSIPTPGSYSSVRNPRVPSLRLLEKREETQDNREHRRKKDCVSETSSSDKRVTFEEDRIVLPKSADLTISSPESGGSGFEDQGRFRLSTTPLSHSSPSEISGNLSGYALESLNLAHHQKPHSECELSELACSHADMSRLTYVSEQENTYPITAAAESLEDHKSDLTSELSTTIVRASPTPSEEETTKKLRDEVLGQTTEKVSLPCIIQVEPGVGKVAETPSLSSGFEDGEPNFTSSQDISSRSGEHLEASGVDSTSGPSEQNLFGQAFPNKPGLCHRSGPAIPSLLVLNQKTVDRSQRITSAGLSTASSDSSSQIPNPCTSVNQPSLAPHISAHTSAAKAQNQPPLCPALWTGHSLYTGPVAQQYLGPVPSSGNAALPQCHAGVQVCGISGCSSYPLVAPEHVASGMCLGPNLASGVMGPSSLYNLCSTAVHQNLLSTAKPFPVQPVAANCETKPWDLGMTSGFGNARVPEELRFPHACCVGIASQTLLSVLNPTDRWLQVSIRVLSICVNGEKVDLSTQTCLVFKNKVVIRPHATEEIKILFIPTNSGIFRCTFSVASWPFSADADTIVQAEALGSRVTLTAVAETPVIEVETEKKGVLDFGDLTYEGWKALPLKLINRTHATVPIRLIINANALAWRCFTFSKEPVHASLKATPYSDGIAQLVAPSVVSHVMPASYDGQDPEFLIVWVIFHSPKKLLTSEILGSAEEFLARVDIEVDSPNPIPVLRSVDLRARAGIARIHAPKDLQTMHLLADVNSSTKQPLPLKNAGNIEVYLDIKVAAQGSQFSVDPESLFLKPGEEHEVVVSFTPKEPKAYEERILKIFVQPLGPQYEVVLKGEVISSGSKALPPEPHCSDIPLILSNKQFLTWGGIPLGRTQLQKLALRNSSTTTAQNLRLLIKGQDQDCFQIKNTFGSEERLTSNCEIRICPGEDCVISVLFAPTRLSCMLAKLEIKQLGSRSQPGIKFMIPLSGYGGTSNLILEDVKKLSDSYLVTVNDLFPGKESKVVFSIRNTGSRAAFVKAVCFKDSQRKVLLDPKVMRIFPDKFVLKERTQEDITLIYSPSHRKNDSKPATELLTVYFFGGDEISRQLYRRALLHKPGAIKQILPEHSVLQNIDFAEAFQDELLTDEACDLPQRPNDIQLFYGSMRKITLSVIGEFREFLQPSSSAMLESKSESGTSGKQSGNVSLDVLPVKGPQGPPFLSHIAHPAQDTPASAESWAVHPEHLILVAPSSCDYLGDMAKTGRFQIINNSVRVLKFELYWPAHCLTVTPQHGFITPQCKIQILVSPNSSLSTKQSMFPWSGLIYIHCDNGQKKMVKVQIREDLTQEPLPHLATSTFGILVPGPEPSISHLTKPITKPPSTKVAIRSKTVIFPPTEPGQASENYLELENRGPTDVKWHLSSFAPPYVKGVDETGDVFRATYTAFRCSPISGTLEGHGIQKVSIMFLPRDGGDYAQFWDVECHPANEPHMKHTLRFQLSGQSIRAENDPEGSCSSRDTLIKVDAAVVSRRRAVSETSTHVPGRQLDLSHRGVYAPKDVYMFLPTKLGESRTLKVNLRNNSFFAHALKFLSPRAPFYIKHSKYSLRARHYIHIPVHFRPESVGRFEALLVIQTDEGKSIAVRLIGEALGKS